MAKFIVTLLDTAGIQDYIFKSNRLQENIGASELVYRATTLWAFRALKEAELVPHNVEKADRLGGSWVRAALNSLARRSKQRLFTLAGAIR